VLPFLVACGAYRGRTWKLGAFLGIYVLRNAIYDGGMYLRFFLYGPSYMKAIMNVDPEHSFASIQARLFVKYCGKLEIDKATGKEPRKHVADLAILKSFRNQTRDYFAHLRNIRVYLFNK